jgi:hypothetical protein
MAALRVAGLSEKPKGNSTKALFENVTRENLHRMRITKEASMSAPG